jgi:beta-glucuronidase
LVSAFASSPSCTLSVPVAKPGALHDAADALAATLGATTSSEDIIVCLEPGVHTLVGRTLRLNATHNHPRGGRVVWRGADSTVSAGAKLTKWMRCFDGVHCNWPEWNGVYAHAVADVPNATAEVVPFRQLWVAGSRAPRVVSDASSFGLQPTPTGYDAAAAVPTSWVDQKVELRWPRQVRNWIEPRCTLSNVSGAHLTVEPACWAALTKRNNDKTPPAPLLIEGIVGPPPPGEFASDAKYVYWRPPADDPYAAPTDAWAPLLESIVAADGLVGHSFENVSFSHATWRHPATAEGYVPSQSLVTPQGEPPAAAAFTNASGLRIERCAFRNLGSAYALSVGGASHDTAVTRCSFDALSGGAVKLGNVDNTRALTTDPKQMDSGFDVSDNTLAGVALEYRGAAAVFAGYVASASIAHNTIRDTGYTGISLGWGWGGHVTGAQTFMRDNHLLANSIHGVMSALNDGGCTYTLGPQPGSTVSHNFCDVDHAPVVGSFYHDNGSRYFNTTNNVASASPAPCVYLQGCCNAPALDVSVSNLWCRHEGAVRNGCAAGAADCSKDYSGLPADCHCSVDAPTVHTVPTGAAWPAEAQAIVDAAGARA